MSGSGSWAPSEVATPGSASAIRVLCVTPTGREGRGGIDRLYNYVRSAGCFPEGGDIDLRYAVSRGDAGGWLWLFTFPFRALAVGGTILRFRPHVVHINFATGGSLVRKFTIASLARLMRVRVIIHFHGDFPEDAIAHGTIGGRLFLSLCRLAHSVVALGEVSRDRFVRQARVPPDRLRIVPNGIVDFALHRTARAHGGPIRILFAGEVGDRKGVGVLIEALQRLAAVPEWNCTIAGNGDIARYAAMIPDTRGREHVRFTGWISSDEVHRLMIEADIVVLPSMAENMPLSLIEGSCAGAALVATPVTETRAIVRDGENGIIVSRDPQALAAALRRLIEDRQTLARMQARSRAIFEENFTIEAFARKLADVYRETGKP